jgi:hypothetical protein
MMHWRIPLTVLKTSRTSVKNAGIAWVMDPIVVPTTDKTNGRIPSIGQRTE